MPDGFARTVERQRRHLKKQDKALANRVLRAFHDTYDATRPPTDRTVATIEAAVEAGERVSRAWLERQSSYQEMVGVTFTELKRFFAIATSEITDSQQATVHTAKDDSRELATVALGRPPSNEASPVGYGLLVAPSLRYLAGYASNGQPLTSLFADLPSRTTGEMGRILAAGIKNGVNPKVTARELTRVLGLPLTRALTVARTETLYAYRAASLETYRSNRDVVTGWTWWATLDATTCPSCWAMHGTELELEEDLDSHPNCRCTPVPKTVGWDSLGVSGVSDTRPAIESGPDRFNVLDSSVQRKILGNSRYDAYQAGRINLNDTVTKVKSKRWGTVRRAATVDEALQNAARR